jgi:hypothetical protein
LGRAAGVFADRSLGGGVVPERGRYY